MPPLICCKPPDSLGRSALRGGEEDTVCNSPALELRLNLFQTFSPLPDDDCGFTRNVYFVMAHQSLVILTNDGRVINTVGFQPVSHSNHLSYLNTNTYRRRISLGVHGE